MKKIHIGLIGMLLLAGCGGKSEGGGQSSAARLDGKEKGSELLAYEHNVSVDTNEAQVRPLYEKVVAACKADTANGCLLLDSSLDSGRYVHARISMRAKPAGIKKLVEMLAAEGEVTSQGTKVEDLGRPVLDSKKRLEMLRQYQAQLQELEKRSGKEVDALIKVTKELATVQVELEQATAANAVLMQRIDTDLLNVALSAEGKHSFWTPVKRALGNFTENLSEGVASAITAMAYILPWLLAFIVLFPLGRKGWRRLRGVADKGGAR
ncbi:DUF4349 domain-containing protein [Janthinobacterium sp. UMAB-56]|uniref:DUF4349 domain-containing protein n=1 Tax=Janthinobacterium sp. UMAB-56 TaxID=1365361 RepID=UPI001C5906EE|nr:DUF4349 domain-containing protein [Janthinobacterium sp. UMAB-56]